MISLGCLIPLGCWAGCLSFFICLFSFLLSFLFFKFLRIFHTSYSSPSSSSRSCAKSEADRLAASSRAESPDGEWLWYTGEGKNDLNSSRRQTGSQTMKGGNLALLNSHKLNLPIRLARYIGKEEADSYR